MMTDNNIDSADKKPLWMPSEKRIDNSNMKKFINYINEKYNKNFENYHELYDWSINEIDNFWESVADFGDIKFSKKADRILHKPENADETIFGHSWFIGAELNFAENLLRFRDDRPAIKYWYEDREKRYLSYSELYDKAAKCAEGLKQLGVKKGDRVAGYISNNPEAIIAMLATTSIGAIWSSSSPDFGFQGVLDRFGQIQPKVLIANDGYFYNGKKIDNTQNIKHLAETIPDIEKVVILPTVKEDNFADDKFMFWDELLSNNASEIKFEQTPFDHPVYIMYSSGTTGKPKCIVHGAGGTLLQHYKELAFHTNLKKGDSIMYFTTCGWMMWNWLVSSLMIGATVFLYDGSPSHPDLDILWEAVEEEKINIFGTSPKYISALDNNNIEPAKNHDISSLKTMLSTGAPLTHDNFLWVYEHLKKDIQLSSISGGTDIVSCFMLGNPMLPVYSEELQSRGLGMKVEAFNESGEPVIEEKGELVCTEPFPCMPVCFWDDTDNERYHSAYFEHFPGVWRHGDFIKITNRGSVIVFGRSDATLNPGGIRIGTAEIYRVVEAMDEIVNSIVVGQSYGGDIRVMLFVVPEEGFAVDDQLVDKIKNAIRVELTPRHVPKIIKQISDVPETLNGKKVELAVTNILNGDKVTNESALRNPESLEQFKNMKFD